MFKKCLACSNYFIILRGSVVVYLKEDTERIKYLIEKKLVEG